MARALEPPQGPIDKLSARRGARSVPTQKICTECGTPFSAGTELAKTCSQACRKRRSVRASRQGDAFTDYAVEVGEVQAAMESAVHDGLDQLPSIARDVLAEELRPVLREALTGRVLQGIAAMVDLLPLAQAGLKDDLTALTPLFNDEGRQLTDPEGHPIFLPDYDRRQKAYQIVFKDTLRQPGLAPQPEAPDAAPIVIQFPEGMSMPVQTTVDGEAVEAAPQLELSAGEKQCDSCHKAKLEEEFVAGSDRCWACFGKARAKVEHAIEERTAARPT